MEGVGLGMEVEQRLRGEEGVERHIFGHSRETGENMFNTSCFKKVKFECWRHNCEIVGSRDYS